jgi:hypothetical protein
MYSSIVQQWHMSLSAVPITRASPEADRKVRHTRALIFSKIYPSNDLIHLWKSTSFLRILRNDWLSAIDSLVWDTRIQLAICFTMNFAMGTSITNLCNENQLDALFFHKIFRHSASTCFGHTMSKSCGGWVTKKTNPLTPELSPSAQRCLTRFLLEILLLEPWISLICACKTNKCNNYSFSLLVMYGSSYMFWHYIAILRERS